MNASNKFIIPVFVFALTYFLAYINYFLVGQFYPGGNEFSGTLGAALCMISAIIVTCTYVIVNTIDRK